MQHQTHTTSTGHVTYRGYVITGTRGAYTLCGQTYKTLDEATAEVDKMVKRNEADLCPSCGYHETRCRMTPDCIEAHLAAIPK